MNVVILCGGRGVIDPESRQRMPKAMLRIGGKPLLWHIMKTFASAGFDSFVLALGEGGDEIRRFFYYHHLESRDVNFSGGRGAIEYLTQSSEENWTVKCIDTGINARTGSRIARCRRYLEGNPFFTTYSDCLCNVDLGALREFHRRSGKMITVTGVQPTSRFGAFATEGTEVVGYTPETKMVGRGGYLNGGYMVMEPAIFNRLEVFNECNLEGEVFSDLAVHRQVGVFPHDGYWQAIDTERDLLQVSALYAGNKRPWLSLQAPE